jgi:hypothetical protein
MPRDNKRTYMTNDIVRTGALNCFEELTSTNKQLNNITSLCLSAKTLFFNNEILQIDASRIVFKSCLTKLILAFACKRHANCKEILTKIWNCSTSFFSFYLGCSSY